MCIDDFWDTLYTFAWEFSQVKPESCKMTQNYKLSRISKNKYFLFLNFFRSPCIIPPFLFECFAINIVSLFLGHPVAALEVPARIRVLFFREIQKYFSQFWDTLCILFKNFYRKFIVTRINKDPLCSSRDI